MLAAKRAMAAASPDLAVADAAALDELVEQANALPRMQSLLLSVFGVISAGITALGSFGVMNQIVQNRRCELAIRAALGATPRAMRFHVLGLNGRLVLLGLAAGTGVAWLMAGPAEAVIPGIQRDIIWPLIGVPLGVLLVTQAASWIPAVRAARTCVRELLATV
jgi:ABC-type antimicrobial peptide transport system permease subunit